MHRTPAIKAVVDCTNREATPLGRFVTTILSQRLKNVKYFFIFVDKSGFFYYNM